MSTIRDIVKKKTVLATHMIKASRLLGGLFCVSELKARALNEVTKKKLFEPNSIKFEKTLFGTNSFTLGMFFFCVFSGQIQATSEDISSKTKTPAAWYAIGCEAYKKGELGKACCFWQRACAVGGNTMVRKRCAHNCRCVYQKFGLEETPPSWWQRVSYFCARLPLLFLQILFLLALYSALLFLYRGRRQRITRTLMATVFTLSVVLSGMLLLNHYISDMRILGVVVPDQQLLYAGPGRDYPERGHLICGQMVEVCDDRGEWCKVRSSAREIGWIPRAALMSVKS